MNGPGRPKPVGELLRAAQLEIVAELRGDGGNAPKASLREGRRLSAFDSQNTYEFSFKRWPESLDNRPLLVRLSRSRGAWAPAEVTRLPENRVRVVTEADLGAAPGQAQLRADGSQTWNVPAREAPSTGEESAAERHQELVADLRAAGCMVAYRERMHEKVFIVDDTVLWHGSLNLLANKGPTDLMMRLEDAESCAQARRVMEQARREKPAHQGRNSTRPHQGSRSGQARNPTASEGVEVGATVWDRLYLNVSYHERNEAKRLVNARFDGDNKLWYTDPEQVIPPSRQGWLRPGR